MTICTGAGDRTLNFPSSNPSLPARSAGFGRGGGAQARSAEHRRGWASLVSPADRTDAVDPSGFSGEEPPAHEQPAKADPWATIDVYVHGEKPPRPKPPEDDAEKVGVAVPATDTDTTGSTPPEPPQPPETQPPEPPEPDDWTQNPYVQTIGGFFGGLALGIVPFAGTGQQVLDEGGVLPHGTPEARRGLAVGQIVGGIFTLVGGVTGEVLGGVASVTGIGAAVGVPAMVVSTTLVVGGAANIWAGLQGLSQSMMSTGLGNSGSARPSTLQPGPHAKESIPAHRGKPTAEEQRQVNKLMEKHGCHTCGTKDPGTKSGNAIADHQPPQALGEPKEFLPHCNNCKARQGGEVLQELRRTQGP
jgi:hypothetical protein